MSAAFAWIAALGYTVAALVLALAGSWLWIVWSVGSAVWVWIACSETQRAAATRRRNRTGQR